MSNIKAIFDKIYVGSNITDDNNNNVIISGNVKTSGDLTIGTGKLISFTSDTNALYGIKDDNGTLKYKNSGGVWNNFAVINNGYINFPVNGQYPSNNLTDQQNGFGIRDNQGVLEFKNRTGSLYTDWTALGTGSGGSGGSGGTGNTAGQLFFGPPPNKKDNINDITIVGGIEYDVTLTTPMITEGKIHCDVWELVPSSSTDGNINSTWKIDAKDRIDKTESNFVMFNFKNNANRNNPTISVTPSATSGTVNLVMVGSVWGADDIGLEYYGNGGSAVITTYNTSTSVTAIVRTTFTNINAETSWQLYAGIIDTDGSFKLTSTNSIAGIYKIMPEGMVNLYGMSQGSRSQGSTDGLAIDNYTYTWIPPSNTLSSTPWPNAAYGGAGADSRVQFGHHCMMYNPQIAVNTKINMIAVVSSGMFFKYYLNNNGSNTLSNDKTSMTINVQQGSLSYYSQDFLYFIKDGYTVTKREKIFSNTTTNISAGSVGACEYGLTNLTILYGSIQSPTALSISIIAVGLYFVICGILVLSASGNTTVYINLVSYNSRGENISSITIESKAAEFIFYPKIFNGSGNNIFAFYYTGRTAMPTLNFQLITIDNNGILAISKAISSLYTNSTTSPNILRLPFISKLSITSNAVYTIKLIQHPSYVNTSIYTNYFYLNIDGSVSYTTVNNNAYNMTYNSSSASDFLLDSLSSNQLSRYNYVQLDVIQQNNYTYVIFSANTNADANTYNLYYAFIPSTYTAGSTGFSNLNKLITNTTNDNNIFTGYVQIIPKGIYDTYNINSRRILVVWLGKSSLDVTDGSLRGTYYKFINLTTGPETNDTITNDNILSITQAVKLTSNIPAQGGYYNLVQKSNGNIHLLFNAGHNSIYEYVLPANGTIFYVRLSPTRNIKHSMMYNKILPGQVYDGFVRASYCGKLSVGIFNDRIVGVGQLINPDLASVTGANDFISSYINNTNNRWYQTQGAVNLHSVPTTSTFFYEVTTPYDWNIYNRISDGWISSSTGLIGDFSDTNIQQSVLKIYNNVFYVVFTCTTSIVTAKKLFYSFSINYGQTWTYPIRVTNVTTTPHTLYPENNPDMIIDSSGVMHIVFESTSVDYSNSQIYYVKGSILTPQTVTFTDIYLSQNVNNIAKGGISAIINNSQTFPRIVKCTGNKLAVCWYGTNSTYSTSKIFVGTHANNGETTTRWSIGNIITLGDWANYAQLNPELNYNTNGILLLAWRGNNISQTTHTRIYIGVSIDDGLTFTLQTSTIYVNSSAAYVSGIGAFESYLDNSNMIHIMFLINSNVITNSAGNYNANGTTVPQSDIFVTRGSLGSITSNSTPTNITNALTNTNLVWSTPYLLTNYRYNIPNYQNATYGTYGHGLQILNDIYNKTYYIYKMRYMNYSTDLFGAGSSLQGGNNPAYLTFCTYDGVNYSDVKSVMNEYFHSTIKGSSTTGGISSATSTSGYSYPRANIFNVDYSFTIDINKNNNNLYILCNGVYSQYYGPAMTRRENMYLYEYTQDNKNFGVLDYRPILNFEKAALANIDYTSSIQDLNPKTILLNDGRIMSVYSTAVTNTTTFRTGGYYSGVVSIYNPNNSSKFVVRSSNTRGNLQFYGDPRESDPNNNTASGSVLTERDAGTIQTDNDYWTSFSLINTPKPALASSMIILCVCQDPLNTSNIYILYRYTGNGWNANTNLTTPYTAVYNNLYITYSNSGGNTTNSTNFNFNTEVKVVLDTSGLNTSGDGNNVVLSGSIFAYNNVVYVIYTNANGRLFLSRLTYTPSGGSMGLAFNTASQNTFYITSTTAATVTAGEGNGIGGHVLDYSLDVSNNLVLHILYHGAVSGSTNNKVYYYLNATNLTSTTPTFSALECVVPQIYRDNTDTTTRTIGYGDMVIDRTSVDNTKIYIVYSTHNYPVNDPGTTYVYKEHNRFIVYTYKSFSNSSSAWITNSQFDICTGTTSGFAQAIYRNPNSSTSECYSSCDQYPKLYLKNNILHMVTLGNHYNGYLNGGGNLANYSTEYLSVNYNKYYSKDTKDVNSRFVNNNQPINKSLYFNISEYYFSLTSNRQLYYNSKQPSIIVDNNNTIHVISNITSNYRTNIAERIYRNYHFLTTDDASYKTNIKATAITKSTKSLTTQEFRWTNIKDFILSDSSNSQTALYALCYQFTGYDNWYVFNTTLNPRLIMQFNTTTLVYSINTNISSFNGEQLTTYTQAFLPNITQDEKTIKVLEDAVNVAFNQMTSGQLNQASSFNFTNSTVISMRFAIILQTINPFITPQVTDLTINYSLSGYQLNVTNQYIIKIKTLSLVSFTPPNDGQSRTAYVYITDGSSSGTTQTTSLIYTEIVQNTNPITQTLTNSYAKLSTNNGLYLTNNNINNTTYTIDNSVNSIRINSTGQYKIELSFDYSVSDAITTYFSIDGIYQEALKSNNVSNIYDRVMISRVQNVSTGVYNFILYVKTDSVGNPTINVQNLKIYVQKIG